MTSKLVVNTIEADTGISSVSFASSISMNSTAKFHFSAAGVDIGADTNINRPAAGVLGFNISGVEKVRIDTNGHLNTSGIVTAANFKSGVTNVHNLGVTLTGGQLDVGSNIKIGTAGVVTATSFSGSGANLTSLPSQLTLSNNADNRIITGGSGTNLNGEANLTFDGTILNLTKSSTTAYNTAATTNDSTANLINSGAAGHATLQFQSLSGGSANTGQATISAFNESSGSKNTALTFGTRQNSDATVRERLRIDSSGSLIVGGTSYGAAGTFSVGANGSFRQVLASGTAQDTLIAGISGVSNGFQVTTDASNNQVYKFHNGTSQALTITDNKTGVLIGSPFSRFQCGSHTFSGGHGMYADSRVGMSNHGSLTGLMLASTYNDGTHPEYGLVFVQGPTTSSYNVWGICPDGPAKGNSLNLHYGAQDTNIHQPSKRKFEFTGEGYALTPNMPYCMLGRGSSFNVASVTGTKIIFDTKAVDRGSNYNTSNGRFTAPVAGDYLLMLIVEYAPSGGVNQFHTGVWKNGVHTFGSGFDSWNNHGDGIKGSSMVLTANLALNDYIEFATYHGSGGTQQLTGGRCKATIRFLG